MPQDCWNDPRVPTGVTILDGGTIGLELVPYASDASRVLLLDAMNSGNSAWNARSDDWERFARHDGGTERAPIGRCRSRRRSFSGVDRSSGDCRPGRAACVHGLGYSLSPAVDAALLPLVDAALAQLQLWKESRDASLKIDSASLPPGRSSEQTIPEPPCEGGGS